MVSVIITTYNRKNVISKSLASVLGQTYKDLEIIVVDDCSTDGTEEFIKKEFRDRRIKYFKLARNQGATAARNFGLDKMKGDYFLVWDSDDILYSDAIEKLVKIHGEYKNLAVVSAPARSLLNNNEIQYAKVADGVVQREFILCRALPSNHKVRIARTSLCGDIRYKAKNIDFLVNVEMAERGDWYCQGEYLADVILESDKNSLTINRKKTNLSLSAQRAPHLAHYLTKYKELLKSKYPARYAGFSYGAAFGFYAGNDKSRARRFIIEAIKTEKNLKYILFYIFTFLPFGRTLLKIAVKIKNKLLFNL